MQLRQKSKIFGEISPNDKVIWRMSYRHVLIIILGNNLHTPFL